MFYSTSAIRTIVCLSALLLPACDTSRRESSGADTVTSSSSLTTAHTESLRLDSLLCSFTFSADSITILIPPCDTVTATQPATVTMHRVSATHNRAASSRTMLTTSADSAARTLTSSRQHSFSQSSVRPVTIASAVIAIIPAAAALLLLIALFRRFMKKIE